MRLSQRVNLSNVNALLFVLFLVVLLGCSGAVEPLVIMDQDMSTPSPPTPRDLLVGTWVLVQDKSADGTSQQAETETIQFDNKGYVVTDGVETMSGTFEVTSEFICLVLVDKGTAITMKWKYTLDEDGLHVDNKQGGISHYRRIDPQP